MLTQILSAQSDIGATVAGLNGAGDASLIAQALAHQQTLAKLERALSSGSAAMIAPNIRGEIAAVLAASANLSQQAKLTADQQTVDLATAQARARATVQEIGRDIYGRRIFDPYLRFASEEDEVAYRRREEENRRAIAEALAEHTPEGDLRAAQITERQLQDAGAHGADASPQFSNLVSRNRENMNGLETAIGQQTSAQVDEQSATRQSPPSTPTPATNDQLASVLATFRAAGINGGVPAHDSGHGLSVDNSSADQSRSIRT